LGDFRCEASAGLFFFVALGPRSQACFVRGKGIVMSFRETTPMNHRRFIRVAMAGALVVAFLLPLGGSAKAAPGTPGTPQPPVPVFTEDFENGQGATPILVDTYPGLSTTYTADPAYLVGCNGWITSQAAPATEPSGANCNGFWGRAKQLAGTLGQWSGADPATNHAVIAYTSNFPGPDKIQLKTVNPVPLAASNRFIAFSVDVAAQNCFAAHPLLKFSLVDGATAIPAFVNPIDPCTAPQAVINGTAVGTYFSDSPLLFSGNSVGIQLVNGQADGTGNDSAFDNVRIQDVTPQLDKSFSAATAEAGTDVTLTYTITNTRELAAKNGWSFGDVLPAGLVATPGTATTNCPGGTAGATAGTVSVSGSLAAGQASCTANVVVHAATAGTYTTCAANVTAPVGVNLPGCASVQFVPPVLVFDAHAHGGKVDAPLVGVGPLVPSNLSCTTTPGSDSHSLLSASLPALGSLGVITTSASGTVSPAGLRSESAQATTATVRLLGGLVSADAVSAVATANEDGAGNVTTGGSVGLVNLRVAGVPVANPPVNTSITIPLVASVVINERVVTPNGVQVNALHITLLSGLQVVVSHAQVALLRPSDPCPPV
jgi:uncharacterized repeat protein (TIGR01451 family)